MDELLQTPPLDSQGAAANCTCKLDFDWCEARSYESWFYGFSHPSTQGEVAAATVVVVGQDEDAVDEGGEDDELGEEIREGEGDEVGEGDEEDDIGEGVEGGKERWRRGFRFPGILREFIRGSKYTSF